MEILPFFRRFRAYVNSFMGQSTYVDHNITIKVEHTHRVCRHSLHIARSLDLSRDDRMLVLLSALFHDIGRFPQIVRYHTFNDRKSEDHARLGVREIKALNLLDGLGEQERHTILTAIMLYNRLRLPQGLSPRYRFLCSVIRDADKLDILDVLIDYYRSPENGQNPALDLELPVGESLSAQSLANVLSGRSVNMENVHSRLDFRLLQASWVFDIHFDYSMRRLRESGQIHWLLDQLPPDPQTRSAAEKIDLHMREFLPSWNAREGCESGVFADHDLQPQ